MRLVYKKLRLMRLSTEETLLAAATFIIYHKNKDTRLKITLCKLEIFCFPFIKKYFYNKHIYSALHALYDESNGGGGGGQGGERSALCNNQ